MSKTGVHTATSGTPSTKVRVYTPPHNNVLIVVPDDSADYERFGWDAISIVTYFNTKARFLIADPNIIKQIGASRTLYPKPIRMYKTLEIYGPNLVTSEGAVWTRHRKITSPAFSELNIQLVWCVGS